MKFLILFFGLFFHGCYSNFQNENDIKVIDFSSGGQLYDMSLKKIVDFGKTIRVVYKGANTIYITRVYKSRPSKDLDPNGNVIYKLDTASIAYVINRNDKNGLSYELDNFKTQHGIQFVRDTLLHQIGLNKTNLNSFNLDLGKPTTIVKMKDGAYLEKYAIKKLMPAYPDSVYRFYDKNLKEIDFTLSKKQDSLSNSKLYRVSFIHNAMAAGNDTVVNSSIPKREISSGFKLVEVKDTKIFNELFGQFEEDKKRIKLN